LSDERKEDVNRMAEIHVRLDDFARFGRLRVPTQLRELVAGLWEIKAHDTRLPFFYADGFADEVVRLTSGFVKRSQKTPRRQIHRAVSIMTQDRTYDVLRGSVH
jgi:phage-related protein